MINQVLFQKYLTLYKDQFADKLWPNEKDKWEAVKWFQDHWNANEADFPQMLGTALRKISPLMTSTGHYPCAVIQKLALAEPETVRAMFLDLYDENQDVWERMNTFKQRAGELFEKYKKAGDNLAQDENAISTYLWLRYPDKYYIYKYSIVRETSKKLEGNCVIKQSDYGNNIRNFHVFYEEIHKELMKDEGLRKIFRECLTEQCYPDPQMHTVTNDFCFFLAKYLEGVHSPEEAEWWPMDYHPGLTAEDWGTLLNDPTVFNGSSLEIMKRFLDNGGQGTCTELSAKYGESKNFYNAGSSALAKRVAEKTGCPVPTENIENSKWWPILYVGKYADKEQKGSYIWKLRDELKSAGENTDLSNVKLYAVPAAEGTEDSVAYGKADFLSEVFMTESQYNRLSATLKRKKNIILQGAPGVGKTFAAKRLAYSMMGCRDDKRIEFVQFHQNYSYEDFVMGYKPAGEGFELRYGIFYRFCQKAASHPDQDYYFIIDEINRGNMSKIFGELLMLIEADYRGQETTLAYNGLPFSVPERLHIIGMMNTADRSLAMIDYALRRRFSFFDMEPGFESAGFLRYQKQLENETFDTLIDQIKALNREIARDRSLGKGFCIGHSYFCNAEECSEVWMQDVVEFDILPMLREYWFDDSNKLQYWENALRGVFQ